ncbi:MAG: hypothetical protein HUJ42_00260 [Malacoplasma sp.]|nr:hypothetical protein [Malacoplasma sp.]
MNNQVSLPNVTAVPYVNIDQNGIPSEQQAMYYSSKLIAGAANNPKTPEQIYNNIFNGLIFPKYAFVDFTGQFGSMYSLLTAPKDAITTYVMQSLMNSAYKLSFASQDFNNFNGSSFTLLTPFVLTSDATNINTNQTQNISDANFNVKFDPSLPLRTENSLIYIFGTSYGSSVQPTAQLSNREYLTNVTYNYYYYNQQTLSNSNDFNEFMQILSQFAYEEVQKANLTTNNAFYTLINLFNAINAAASKSINAYFAKLTIFNNNTIKNMINNINQLLYTGLYEYFVKKYDLRDMIQQITKDIVDNKGNYSIDKLSYSSLFQLTLLRLLGVNIASGVSAILNANREIIAASATNPDLSNQDINVDSNILTSFTTRTIDNISINNNAYNFTGTYFLIPAQMFSYKVLVNFQNIKMVSIYNPLILFLSWIVFELVIALLTLQIYNRKDFK